MSDGLRELLAELAESNDEATIQIAAETLAEGTPRVGLAELCEHQLPAVRRAATLALGQRADPEDRELLEGLLVDPNANVRRAGCQALAALQDARSLHAIGTLLADRLPTVRIAAARALRAFPERKAVAELDELLRGERVRGPREAAVESLALLPGQAAEMGGPVIGALACHVPREEDLDLRELATLELVRLVGARPHRELLPLFREVPQSGRAVLADSLRANPEPLGKGLARIVRELRDRRPDAEALRRFGSDLTRRARDGELTPAHGRERELKAIRDRLARGRLAGRGPRSIVLVGPSGAGKTALVCELARRLVAESVLVPTVILEATTGEVLSGTRYLGEWQTRLKELQEAIKAPYRAIWYVPDLNRLVDAGTSEHSQESFASMLAPALERGEVVLIGESTPEAYRRGLDRFPGISKLFWKLDVEPPAPAASREVLGNVAEDLVSRHAERGVELVVPPIALDVAQDLADDYFPTLARPGNAVRLLREAADAAVQEALDGLDPEDEPPEQRRVELPSTRILDTLSRLSGVPVRLLDPAIPIDLREVRQFFQARVLGQDEAVETVVDLISLVKAGLTDPARPLGVLLFVGPTGVGKTELAKALAEFIFGSAERLVRVDLGEFRDPGSFRRLVGDPHAPEPAARSGLLTAPVRERPFSVVLLDEVEKAHRNVFDLLLPLLDEGRLVDERGRVTDFRRTIVVMTSNTGSDLREDSELGFSTEPDAEARAGKVQRVLEDTFRPEFLNRITKTVVFSALSLEVMRQLTRREVRRVLRRKGIVRRRVVVETDDSVIGVLLQEGFSARYGARPLKRRVEELLLRPLARAILRLKPDEAQAIIRLEVLDERVVSQVVYERDDAEEEEAPLPVPRGTARIKDPRHGKLISLDELEQRILELAEKVEDLAGYLEQQELRAKKKGLLDATLAGDFWADKERASRILSEIASLERTLEIPAALDRRIERLDRLLDRARSARGESRALHDLLARIDELAHEIEFTTYAVRCPSPEDQGDAYLTLRRVDDARFPQDVIADMVSMYRRYLRGKRLATRVIYEAVTRRGRVREVGLRIEGIFAFGLLKGEAGLHHWIARGSERRNTKQAAFVRVSVLPPAGQALKAAEVTLERRPVTDEAGVLLRKHRQHLVLTHQESLVALEGSVSGRPDAEENALAFLAARVAAAGRAAADSSERGVVRRYVASHLQVVRDLPSGLKAHLDHVLDGKLDEFVLPRILEA